MNPWSEAPHGGVQSSHAWSPPRRAGFLSSALLLLGLLLGLVAPQGASAVASSKQVTAILQGSSQSGWVTDAQLKAEYDKWKVYPNVTAAVRSVSSNKDDAKLLAWESSGMKYFYTAASSDYRFSGSMYAPAASPDAVMARTNNLGLYIHQLFTQLTADSSWNWQTGIGKTNWAQIDAWVMSAKAKGKKVVWNEPSGAWNAVKVNTTAMSYFNKWKDTVVVTYGTNFPDQVNSQAKPGAVALASAITAPIGVSVQSFNFTEASPAQAVTRAGVKALAQAGIDAGATYVEFSGSQAEMQLTSQFILGSEDFLSAPAVVPPSLPKATAPKNGAYTATLIGLSQLTRSDNGQKWSTEKDLRDEYNLWNAKANIKPSFRGMAYSKNDSIMQGWEADGFKYFWTAGSSDYRNSNGNFYVSEADGDEVLRRTNSVGLYLHELASQYTKEGFDACAQVNGGGNCKWDWATGIQKVDWGRIDHWVSIARDQGKKIIWSEPSHGFVAMLNDASARSWFARWGDTLVPMWSTNFSNECRIAQSEQGPKCQVKQWSRPGAKELAAKFSGGLVGDSVQSWYFRDQVVTPVAPAGQPQLGDTRPKDALTAANALALANDGKDHGATYFQIEGYGEQNDMNIGASPSWYMTGIRQFLDSLATVTPPAVVGVNAQLVPLYGAMNWAIGDHKLSRDPNPGVNYDSDGIAGYVYDRQAPGSVPLYELWSDATQDWMYTADYNEVLYNEHDPYGNNYYRRNIIGYVMAEKYADTLPLYPLWNNASNVNDHRYTISPAIRDLYQLNQDFARYQLQDVSAYLFDNDGRQITTPLTFLSSNEYQDSMLARDLDISTYTSRGWVQGPRVGAIYTEPIAGAVPVYEAWSDISTDHLYTTDPLELYRNMSSWYAYKNVRVIGYAPRSATAEAAWAMHQSWNSGTPSNPGWANHHYSPTLSSYSGYVYEGIAFWVVPLDVHGPPSPTEFDAATFSELGITRVTWEDNGDYLLGNGNPGSGIANFVYRVSIDGGAWSGWTATDEAGFSWPNAQPGHTFVVQSYAVDELGNVGPTGTSGTLVSSAPTATGDDSGPEASGAADAAPPAEGSVLIDQQGYVLGNDPVGSTYGSTGWDLCGGGGPCGTFSGFAASEYAHKWTRPGKSWNKNYNNWSSDCTNFVSQALKAGGFHFIRTGLVNGVRKNDPAADGTSGLFDGGLGAWWSSWRTTQTPNLRLYNGTATWNRVQKLRDHLTKRYHMVREVGHSEVFWPGDVVFFSYGASPSRTSVDHVVIVTKTLAGKRKMKVAGHTKTYDKSFSDVKKSIRAGHPEGWDYYVYRPLYSKANVSQYDAS